MAYSKYYPNGWKSGEVGATPITPEALNNMENGIAAAVRTEDVANNLTTTAAGKVLDARQGKALNEAIQQSTAYRDFNFEIPAYGAGEGGQRAGFIQKNIALSGYTPVSACIGALWADTNHTTTVQLDGSLKDVRVITHYGNGTAIEAHTITVRVFYVKA